MKHLNLFMLACLLVACSSTVDMDEDIYVEVPDTNNDNGNDNTDDNETGISDVSYSADISPIMSQNCTSCHGNSPSSGASVSLTNLSQVQSAIEGNNLIGRVQSGNMPKNAEKLSNTQIQTLQVWEEEGFNE